MLKIGLHYAVRNIMRTPLRSFFTLFSIALIIMLHTILSGVGDSFTKQLSKVFSQQSVDVIVQSKFSSSPLSSAIPNDTVAALTSLSEVKSSEAMIVGKIRLRQDVSGYLLGVSHFEQFAEKLGLSMTQGKIYQEEKAEIMIANQLLQAADLKIGDTVLLSDEKRYEVVGTYASWLSFLNTSLVTTLNQAQMLLNKKERVSLLFLSLKEPYKVESVIEEIHKNYPSLQATKSGDFSESLGSLKALSYLMHIISLMTLVIASAIMLNTFMMAMSERTKEIGILLAIGWGRLRVMATLLMESVLLALLGGVTGFLAALPVLAYLRHTYYNLRIYLPVSLDASLFLEVIIMSLCVGILSIIFPAFYGTKINTAKALRDA